MMTLLDTNREITSDEWLQLAVEAEERLKHIPIFDLAYEYFVKEKHYYFQMALAAEKVEKAAT